LFVLFVFLLLSLILLSFFQPHVSFFLSYSLLLLVRDDALQASKSQ
jgi:hypothetical protein